MKVSIFCAATVLCVGLLASVPGRAVADEIPLDRSSFFYPAFGLSYLHFDGCGDRQGGEIFRKVLMDRLAACPFSPEARATFRTWAAETGTKADAEIRAYIARHGRYPDRTDGMKGSCAEQQASEAYVRLRANLLEYAAGRLAPEAISAEPCGALSPAP